MTHRPRAALGGALTLALLATSAGPVAAAGPEPLRTIEVDPRGTALERGNTLRHELSRARARRKAPVRVVLGSGDYDLAEAGLVVPPWVEIRGAGPNETRLFGSGGAERQPVVRLRGPASLTGVHVEARQGTFVTALRAVSGEVRLRNVHVRSDGARWGGLAVEVSRGAHLRLTGGEVEAVASGQGGTTGLELAPRARADVADVIVRVEADGGPAVGFAVGPSAQLTVQGGSARVDGARGEVRGLHASHDSRSELRGLHLTTRNGRFQRALDLAGEGAALELTACKVEARDGTLSTAVLHQGGVSTSARVESSRLKVAVPGFPKVVELAGRASTLDLEDATLLGGLPAIEAASNTRVNLRCSDPGGVLAGVGKFHCSSCTGAPIVCEATRSRTP
jgi:hypothetical protein